MNLRTWLIRVLAWPVAALSVVSKRLRSSGPPRPHAPWTYILDTQALRGLRREQIAAAIARGHDVAVSPLSIFELLCHLDERDKGADSFRYKSHWLLKARHARILDDPFAAHAFAVAAPEAANDTRFDDKYVVAQLLKLLAESGTLDEFYNRTVKYSSGEEGIVRDCAQRARDLLDREENKYVTHMRTYCGDLAANHERAALRALDGKAFVEEALGSLSSLTQFYRAYSKEQTQLGIRVFNATYPYAGYGVARARRYVVNGPVGGPFPVDTNDMEDSSLCLYLDLTQKRALVTGDKGTRDALGEAISALRNAEKELGEPVHCLARVLTPEEFVAETSAPPSKVP